MSPTHDFFSHGICSLFYAIFSLISEPSFTIFQIYTIMESFRSLYRCDLTFASIIAIITFGSCCFLFSLQVLFQKRFRNSQCSQVRLLAWVIVHLHILQHVSKHVCRHLGVSCEAALWHLIWESRNLLFNVFGTTFSTCEYYLFALLFLFYA